jgi:hypothetical protein
MLSFFFLFNLTLLWEWVQSQWDHGKSLRLAMGKASGNSFKLIFLQPPHAYTEKTNGCLHWKQQKRDERKWSKWTATVQ